MRFFPGAYTKNECLSKDPPSHLMKYLLSIDATHHYVTGIFGNYFSQAIETKETSFYLHHFFTNPYTRLFARVEAPAFVLFHIIKGNATLHLHGGCRLELTERSSYFFYLCGGMEHFIDFTGEPVIAMHFNYHATFVKNVADQYTPLRNVIANADDNGESLCELPVSHGYIENYLWKSLPVLLKDEPLAKALAAEKGRELLRLYCHGLMTIKEQPLNPEGLPLTKRELLFACAVKTQIEADLRIHYTLAELARQTGWNTFAVRQVFPQVYGYTPYQYLIRRRMELGRHLVLSTSNLISSISIDCGYKQEHHFIKLFKETYGVTPGVLRGTEKNA